MKKILMVLALASLAMISVHSQQCVPAPSGLVGWWPAEGNANDIVGTNNGTLVNGLTFVAGEVGQAFSANGAYVSIPDSPSLHNLVTSVTIEAWVQVPAGSGANWSCAVSKGYSWLLRYYGGSTIMTFTTDGPSNQELVGAKNINDGYWHHVAGVYDGTTKFLYVDGALDASISATGTIVANSSPVGIGDNLVDSRGWPGSIDEVSVYNRALTASEIQSIYAAGSSGKCHPSGLPVISLQPTNQVAVVGATAVFNATVASSTPLNSQWFFNGTNLPGATNATLVLTNVQLTNSGIYYLVASNNQGSATSSNAVLEVIPFGAPIIMVNGQVPFGPVSVLASAQITMESGFPGGFVFYTLDGSIPTISSPLYIGPFTLTNTATIQAMSLSADFTQSADALPVFVQIIPGYYVQTSVVGSGTVSANPATGPYPSNSVVTLTATPAQYWAFDHWQGDAAGNANPLNVTMNGPRNIQAVFVSTEYPLTLSTAGGGSVTANGQVIAPATYYPTGSVVTISATANTGWSFLGWQGDASGTNNPLNLTMNGTNNVQAIFATLVGTHVVGGGSIVLNQPNPIPFGTTVTLSAVASNGNYFVTWSGAASGTNSPTGVTVTTANPVANALFGTLPGGKYSLSVVVAGYGGVAISPQQNYYNPGANVTLTASTTNAGTVFYGWTQDATGTNNPLTVGVNSNKVLQANFGGMLTVSISPTNLVVLAGSNAVLTANAGGLPLLTYQWQNDQGLIAGATNSIYSISDATTNDAGNYSVIVSNPFLSVTSAVVTVSVVFPPSITLQPTNQVILAGTAASLEVAAAGTPPLGYQWWNSSGSIADATNATLMFNPAQTNNTDIYFVVVSNAYAVVTSSNALLMVYQPVSIISEPASRIVQYGGAATFSVVASGFPAPSYQWSLNGTNLSGATSSDLHISFVALNNLGNYVVGVSNGYSSQISSTATLSMSPSITIPFAGLTGIWGESALLSVGAVGSGTLSYQWYMNGVAISGATSATYSIPTLQLTNAGLYSVVITSDLGSITNAPAQLIVNPANILLGMYAGVTIQGVAGYSYIIQYSTNLNDSNSWINVTNITLQQPVEIWVDTSVEARSNPMRYYRVQASP